MVDNNNQQLSRVANKNKNHNHRKKKKNTKGKIPWKKIFLWLLGIFSGLVVAAACLFFFYASSSPKITEADLASENTTKIFDAKGKVIWTQSAQEREFATQAEIPKTLKNAVVSIEDRRFYKHHGIDPIRILGAAFANLTGSSLGLQGGSTLTQQLVKLSVFSTSSADQTLKRKAQEAWLALKVEKNFSKNQILTFYINKVYMGHNVYGMKTAADVFYEKPLDDLTLAQYALLAGIPNSPTYYDPYTHPDYAKKRRDLVLQAMVDTHDITQQEADKAKKESITYGLKDIKDKTESKQEETLRDDAFITSTLAQVRKLGYDTSKGSLKIYTNLDSALQKKVYDTVNNSNLFPNAQMQTAITIVSPKDGSVVAQIGGRKLEAAFGLNRATQKNRSTGSGIKPLIDYGPAIEYLNWPTFRTVDDKNPYVYPGTSISLHDWDSKYQGYMTMQSALALSRNIPAVRTLDAVGSSKAKSFLDNVGIKTEGTLGGSDAIGLPASTEQMAAAYAAVSNGGTYYEPSYVSKIVTADGQEDKVGGKAKSSIKSSTAFMLTYMMKSVFNTQATAGFAIIPGLHQAGKTGLVAYPADAGMPNQAIEDAWMNGFTKEYSISVWVGYDQPMKPGNYIPWANQSIPQLVYKQIMTYAMANKPNSDWTAPNTVSAVKHGPSIGYVVKGAHWSNGGLPVAYNNPNGLPVSLKSEDDKEDKDHKDDDKNKDEDKDKANDKKPDQSSSQDNKPTNNQPNTPPPANNQNNSPGNNGANNNQNANNAGQ